MRAAIEREVVEELEVLVVARREDGGIAQRAVQPAGRDLREAHVARIGRDALQSDRWRSRCPDSADLTAADGHTAEAQLVQHRGSENVRVTGDQVPGLGGQRPAEAGHERFLQRARAERLSLVGVERAEAGEQLVDPVRR